MKNVFSRRQMGIPYGVFLAFFVAAPLIVLFYYAFTNGSGQFTLNNLKNFFVDPNTMGTLCYSIVLAVTVTLICLVIAYPVAYILAGSALKRKGVILMLFVLPMWINFTLRITALKEILSLIEGNLAFHPFLNTVIGIYDSAAVYNAFKTGLFADRSGGRSGCRFISDIYKGYFSAVNSWNCQRGFHGVFTGNDELCCAGYAL